MEIGKRIARVRVQAGHTQESLAEATGIRRPHIQKLESDAHSPTVATLSALLNACGSSLGAFFESKIPAIYADPAHAAIHEQLQEVLESEDREAVKCIAKAVTAFHAEATKGRRKTAARQEKNSRATA